MLSSQLILGVIKSLHVLLNFYIIEETISVMVECCLRRRWNQRSLRRMLGSCLERQQPFTNQARVVGFNFVHIYLHLGSSHALIHTWLYVHVHVFWYTSAAPFYVPCMQGRGKYLLPTFVIHFLSCVQIILVYFRTSGYSPIMTIYIECRGELQYHRLQV